MQAWTAGLSQRSVLLLSALLAAAVLALFGVDYVLRPDTLPVRSVSFEGPFKHVVKEDLARAVAPVVTGNFLLLDLDAIKTRAESVPWVYKVSVRREWPDDVRIRFTEQTLVAQWGNSQWINTAGDMVDLRGQAGPAGLPELDGPDGTQAELFDHFSRLSAILAPAKLPIAKLTLTPRHTWQITVDGNLLLVLGHEQPEAKVARFVTVYSQLLAAQRDRMREVDLRYTNGFAVQWLDRAGAAATSGTEG
ncbi:MAG: cell division protein FtsQ/DivIB [Acidiferrobacterales bacterium]